MVVQFQYHQTILMIQIELKDTMELYLIQNDKQARVQWMDDKSKSIENIENLQLETEIAQKPKKLCCALSLKIKVMMYNLKQKI